MSDGSQAEEMARKLGIKKGISMAIMNPPYGFVKSLVEIRETLRAMHTDIRKGESPDLDMIVYFSRGRKGLEETFPRLVEQLAPDGVLWIGWMKPKVLKVDLNEKAVREIAQKNGMEDVESMAFSDEWPMLRFARAKGRK